MLTSERLVLVTGGTGKQGGATVTHLLSAKRARVRVLTRNPDSPKAKLLASQCVELVRGDMNDADSVKAALSGVSAVFSVQNFMDKGGVEAEEQRGKAFADSVKSANGPHLVYTSAEGVERDSGVPHYQSKWRIEQHIRQLGLPATIIRPVAFMDSFATSSLGRGMALGLFRSVLGTTKRIKLVATSDIGWFAARALEDPTRFSGRVIPLAGDELSIAEILETYRKVTGRTPWIAPIPSILPGLIMPKEIASMLKWIGEQGFKANINELRQEHPGLLTFEAWLRTVSSTNRSSVNEPGE
jgi:uncharacterized protein YbjT (DUF2867 family)